MDTTKLEDPLVAFCAASDHPHRGVLLKAVLQSQIPCCPGLILDLQQQQQQTSTWGQQACGRSTIFATTASALLLLCSIVMA